MKKGVISIVSALTGAAIGAGAMGTATSRKVEDIRAFSDKHLALFLMMNQWVKVKQAGKNLSQYFEREGYRNIAVYGMSYAGETLVDELRDTGICVAYGIDKKADTIYSDINIFSLEDNLKKVDAVVVTAITYFDEIEESLANKLNCPILSLEDILYEI